MKTLDKITFTMVERNLDIKSLLNSFRYYQIIHEFYDIMYKVKKRPNYNWVPIFYEIRDFGS